MRSGAKSSRGSGCSPNDELWDEIAGNLTTRARIVESNTRPTVLLVTFGLDYVAPARMPRELKRAGFNVVLLAPRDALCTRTGFVDSLNLMPEEQSLAAWIEALAELARKSDARLLLPGDDATVQVLMQITREPLPALRPAVQAELVALIRRSLGDPAGYLDSIDKARLLLRARSLGLPVAPGEGVADADDAVRVAAGIGYPVIVRPATGSGGKGVRVCANVGELRAAMANLPDPSALIPPGPHRALVQRVLSGQPINRPALAWNGREVAGFCRLRVRPPPELPGFGSVSRYAVVPGVAALNRRLLQGLGVSGFVGTEFRLDPSTGMPYLIEINRRMVPATHTGARVGVDLATALAAVMESRDWTGSTDMPAENERTLALFPQEWLRDRTSPDLAQRPSDAPWDDPALFQAMLRLPPRRR
jgi:predicted ATP-grasp superfamily ATP-dependent carboligase